MTRRQVAKEHMDDWNTLRTHLMRGGSHGHLWIENKGKKHTEWWEVTSPATPPSQGNIYFGVHPVSQIPPCNSKGEIVDNRYIRSQIAYVAALNCVFAEFDTKDYDNDQWLIRECIAYLDPEPSVIINSGGGYP